MAMCRADGIILIVRFSVPNDLQFASKAFTL